MGDQPPCSVEMNTMSSPSFKTYSPSSSSSQSMSLIRTSIPGRLEYRSQLRGNPVNDDRNVLHSLSFHEELYIPFKKVITYPRYQVRDVRGTPIRHSRGKRDIVVAFFVEK